MLTLKALDGGSRSSETMIVYQLLLSSVTTMPIFEKQLIKLPAREKVSESQQACVQRAEPHGH